MALRPGNRLPAIQWDGLDASCAQHAGVSGSPADPVGNHRKCSRRREHSFTALRSAGDAVAIRLLRVLAVNAAMSAAHTAEDLMRLLTYLELTRYTLRELHAVLRELLTALPNLPEGSRARANALMNIHHVRLFIARQNRQHALKP